MRVRMLSVTGDYTIGQGLANFWINAAQGVGQNVTTRLGLWVGEWFLDRTIGTPWLQQILGYNNASLRDTAIKTVILGTFGVSSIVSYSSDATPNNRNFVVTGTVMTIYSTQPVPFGPVVV
jgi:hypothetical protein